MIDLLNKANPTGFWSATPEPILREELELLELLVTSVPELQNDRRGCNLGTWAAVEV